MRTRSSHRPTSPIFNTDAVKATDAQWALVQELQRVFPDATVSLREHRISWKGDPERTELTMYGVLVTRKVGPFDLRREYAAPELIGGWKSQVVDRRVLTPVAGPGHPSTPPGVELPHDGAPRGS